MKQIMSPVAKAVCISALLLSLAACAGNRAERRAALERNPAPCPNVLVLADAGRMIEFAGEGETLENIAYTGEITSVRTTCRYFGDEPIQADVEVDFAFGRGPMANATEREVTYFVAVTRTDRDLIAKQEFTVPVRFRGDQQVIALRDKIDQIVIPRRDSNVSGVNFEIIVGLSVSRDQLIYNRSGKSLKFPHLQ